MTYTAEARTSDAAETSTVSLPTSGGLGVAGGLVGGVVFGAMMHSMGMMPMIAKMVGSDSTALGWIMHLGISAFIGLTFGLLTRSLKASLPLTIAAGGVYGAVWWVLGPLLLMPAKLGMPLFMINEMTLNSLMGHVIFGLIAGVVVGLLRRQRATN